MFLEHVYLGVDIFDDEPDEGGNYGSYTIEGISWFAEDRPLIVRYRYVSL